MKETLDSLASRLGISKTVVSRVLNGKEAQYRISKATAEKVREEARRCFYSLEEAARRRKGGRSGIVGLLVPSMEDPYFATMARLVSDRLVSHGYLCPSLETHDKEEMLQRNAGILLSHNAEAIIAVPCGKDNSFLEKIDRDYSPVVLIDHFYAETELSFVTTDNFLGGVEAVRHLVGLGHSRIACIQGDSGMLTGQERVNGYKKAMEEAGLKDNIKVVGGTAFTPEEGYARAMELLRREDRPTAIFTLSHALVIGAIQAAQELGMDVSRDIAMVSFDNNIHTDHIVSYIRQPLEDMAGIATEIAINQIESGESRNSHILLRPHLVAV